LEVYYSIIIAQTECRSSRNKSLASPGSVNNYELEGLFTLADYLESLIAILDNDNPTYANERKRIREEIPTTVKLQTPLKVIKKLRKATKNESTRRKAQTLKVADDVERI